MFLISQFIPFSKSKIFFFLILFFQNSLNANFSQFKIKSTGIGLALWLSHVAYELKKVKIKHKKT